MRHINQISSLLGVFIRLKIEALTGVSNIEYSETFTAKTKMKVYIADDDIFGLIKPEFINYSAHVPLRITGMRVKDDYVEIDYTGEHKDYYRVRFAKNRRGFYLSVVLM